MDADSRPARGAPRPALSPRKRWLFRFLVVLGLYGVTEGCSYFAFWVRERTPFSFQRVAAERDASGGSEGLPLQPTTPSDRLFVLHPYLGMVLNPGFGGRLVQKSRITEFGFCDPNPPVHRRAPGKVIVGIVGGSVASIFFDEGTAALERELKKDPRYQGKKFEFVNLAVYAYKQPQQVMALNYALALGGEFDIVLNIDGFNEIALYPFNNGQFWAFPLYPIGWHRQHIEIFDRKTCVLLSRMHDARTSQVRWAQRFARWPLCYSVTANLLWKLCDRHLGDRVRKDTVALQQHWADCLPDWAVGPRRRFPSEEAMFEELAAIWRRCSIQMDRICRAHGIRYYHFLQPNQYVPGSKPMGAEERRTALLESNPVVPNVVKGYPYLHCAARDLTRAGVRFHDLTMVFAEMPEPLYCDNCCHFNGRGNEVLAVPIASVLRETREPPKPR